MALGTRIKSFRQLERELKKISDEIGSQKNTQSVGRIGLEIIYTRVKDGFGVTSDSISQPRKRRLKALDPKTIAQRKRRGVRGFRGSPEKSNLTDTGQLLDSIEVRAGKNKFSLIIPNTRRKRRGGEKRVPTNEDVAQYVRGDRPFFAFTNPEKRLLEKTVQKILNKLTR